MRYVDKMQCISIVRLSTPPRCTVRTFGSLHAQVSGHRTGVSEFKGTYNLKPLHPAAVVGISTAVSLTG
jgi:hypothetical protein